MALLEVDNLSVAYGQVEAVKGVSLTVGEGEICALLGANGAGKTTTLRAISGLLQAREGHVHYGGDDITRMPAHSIVHLGMAHSPEGRSVFSTLTVEENLILGGFIYRNRPEAMVTTQDDVYELFPRLHERRNQLAGTLSGGEQQMLAIGRALMIGPKLLLLDEPSLGLAPLLVRDIFRTVQMVNERGVSILLVEQNARLALRIADRAYIMETGHITLSGPASELRRDEKVQQAYLGGRA